MTKSILFLAILLLAFSCKTESLQWPEPTQTSKPWTRWWWMNNGVDKENLSRELSEFAKMGIGGVEITPIYGVKGEEHRTIEFLSPQFAEIIDFTIDEANRLGMGVDLPAGSGWRNGGPFVPREKGLWNLQIRKIEVKKGKKILLSNQFEHATCANFVDENGTTELVDISTPFVTPANGTVFVALRVESGNMVKRPSVGGEGWAIDTFDEEITNWYLDEFWQRLGVEKGKIRCFFHDSFEYTGDFTTKFLEEFEKRRGYKLAAYLHALDRDCTDMELAARVKSDYRQTLSDLVHDSFIKPMTDWANRHESWNRNQAHGSPGNILDLYAACDIPETEIFQKLNQGKPDIYVNKFASSAAHVTGQKLISSESYTWLNEHWTVTPSELVKATNRFFLAGINHMFFHGTCYSPQDAEWPGWLFYASTELNNRNPIWREMPTLFTYIERTQGIMQEAIPQADVLIYWPYFDVAASEGRIFNHLGVNKDAGWFNEHPIAELSEKLTSAGYTFDYISDKQLQKIQVINNVLITEGNANYKAIVVPVSKYVPLETMQKLVELQKENGHIVFDGQLPESVPGLYELETRTQKLADLNRQITTGQIGNATEILEKSGISGEMDLAGKGFYFTKFNWEENDCYLVFNTTNNMLDEWVTLNANAADYVFLHPMTGAISKAESKGNKVRIQLKPEEIVFVRCSNQSTKELPYVYLENDLAGTEIDGHWKLDFIKGGPVLPANVVVQNLKSWTRVGDKKTESFAGTVKYSLEFDWEGASSGFLNLGEVRDCARLTVNDKSYGTLLGPDFSVHVDNLLSGKNKLEVEVTNVAANRIRDLDIQGIQWRNFYDINFVNIDYKPFDASGWEIRKAGLLGPVKFYTKQ